MLKNNSDTLEPRLQWAGKKVHMEQITGELSHLWRMSADNMRISQNTNVRTSVLNLVICVPDVESAQEASKVMRDLASTHIARVTLLILDTSEDAPNDVSTWVTLRSFPILSDVMRHNFEQITLLASGTAARSSAHIVQPLLKADLPVYLWWLNDPPDDTSLFQTLVSLSDRVIVDSSSFLTPERSIYALSEILQASPNSAVSDLNWGRITPWRELVAQFFDVTEYRPYLSGLNHIEIEHAAMPFADPTRTDQGDVSPNATGALLLAGWLKTSLDWKLSSENNREHDPKTGTHSWQLMRIHGTRVLPARSATNKSGGEATQAAELHIRPRILSSMRPGSLCMVRLEGMADNKRATFTVDRERDDTEHVLTSVTLAYSRRPQRTVSMAATRKLSELLHDELEIISRDQLYEQTLHEVYNLLS